MKGLLIGAGPSLVRNLKQLRDSDFEGLLFAVDRALQTCLNEKILPQYVTSLEKEPLHIEHFTDPLIKKYSETIEGIVSHKVTKDVRDQMESMGLKLREINTAEPTYEDTSNVGLFTWMVMGKEYHIDEIYLIGMDYAYSSEDGYTPYEGKKIIRNPHLNRDVVTHIIFNSWKEVFLKGIRNNPHVKTINCTGEGALFGKGIEWQDHI